MDAASVIRQNGYAIRTIRQIQGLSLEELADRTGSHPQSLRNVELENKPASEMLLNRIARALGIDTAAIQRVPPHRDGPAQAAPARSRFTRRRSAAPERRAS